MFVHKSFTAIVRDLLTMNPGLNPRHAGFIKWGGGCVDVRITDGRSTFEAERKNGIETPLKVDLMAGWWFGPFFFPCIGNFIIPTDEIHHFSEG